MVLNNLKQELIKVINESDISIEGIYYVVRDIMEEITKIYNNQLEFEKSMEQQNAAAAQSETDPGSETSEPAVAADNEKKEA